MAAGAVRTPSIFNTTSGPIYSNKNCSFLQKILKIIQNNCLDLFEIVNLSDTVVFGGNFALIIIIM